MFQLKTLLLIPNLITLSRLILIFPTLLLLTFNSWYFAFSSIMLLFLTDFLDGFLARKLGQTSELGAILDPIIDKIVVLSFFTYFYFMTDVPIWYLLIVFVRDTSQLSVVPILLLWKKIPFQVKPKLLPKWGTALNFILLGFYFIKFQRALPEFEQIYPIIQFIELPLLLVSAMIEIYILLTFFPRYIQIFKGTHDTFE